MSRLRSTAEYAVPSLLKTPRGRATAALLAVTVIWGCTFVWMSVAQSAAQRVLGEGTEALGVAIFLVLRFGLSAAGLPLVLPAARRGLSQPGVWRGGLILGTLLFLGFAAQLFGLTKVTPATSAFLTSLYVVFTAIIGLFFGGKLHRSLAVGVVMATAGAAYINGPPELSFGPHEWVTVGSAFVFAIHILATDRITSRASPEGITLSSFIWTTILAGFMCWGVAKPDTLIPAIIALLQDSSFLIMVLLSAVFGNMLALTLMNRYQRELPPVRAAILYALEPIWAVAASLAVGTENPNIWLLVGGGLLLSGNLIAELRGPKSAPEPDLP